MSEAKPEISIIMPAYKSSSFIRQTVSERYKILKSLNVPFELIVVLDGLDPKAAEKIKKLNLPELKLVHYGENSGKGFAVKYGMTLAKGKYIGYIDSDKDLDSSLIKTMYEEIILTKADVIIPSKMHKDSNVAYPSHRKILSRMYYFGLKLLFGIHVSDTQTGAKLYKRIILRRIIKNTSVKRFAFEIEMLYLANKFGYRHFVEVPVKLNFDFSSTIKISDGFQAIKDTLLVFIKHRTPVKLLREKFSGYFNFKSVTMVDRIL